MYEIKLAANILAELALFNLPGVIGFVLLVMAVFVITRLGAPLSWRRGLLPALITGAVVMLLAVLLVPRMIGAHLSDLAYWVDWANLLAIGAGFGFAAVLLAWPIAARLRTQQPD